MLKNGTKTRKYDYCGGCTFYLGAIIVTLICQGFAGIVSAALVFKYPDISKNGDFNTAFMIVVQLLNIAFIILYTRVRSYSFDLPLFKNKTRTDGGAEKGLKRYAPQPVDFVLPVIAAAILMAAMYLPTVWYGYFTRYVLGIPPETGSIDLSTPSSVAMIVIASVFLAPACEETIYRGILFKAMTRRFFYVKAVLLSSLAFMLMHMNPVQVVFQFALGAASACMAYRSGRLFPSVFFHASANAIALAIQLTPMSVVLVGCENWLVAEPVAAAFITLLFFAAGGAALFALIRFGFRNGNKQELRPSSDEASAGGKDGTPRPSECDAAAIKDEVVAGLRNKEGTFRFCIGIGICVGMFLLNLIVSML